jgi:hypothetical protein
MDAAGERLPASGNGLGWLAGIVVRSMPSGVEPDGWPLDYSNAGIPVMAFPMISVWMSCVPS